MGGATVVGKMFINFIKKIAKNCLFVSVTVSLAILGHSGASFVLKHCLHC